MMNLEQMLNVIKTVGDARKADNENRIKNREQEIDNKINEIKNMQSRISDVINIGYAIFENNLEKDFQNFIQDNVERGRKYQLYADGFYHNLGFIGVKVRSKISLAILGGGATGKYDLIVTPENLYYQANNVDEANKIYPKIVSVWHLNAFIKEFPRLESELQQFVESLNK